MPRTPIYREIINDVRAAIESGQLRPGDQLPTIAQLCEQYRASATPVKFALRIMEETGLIETRQGKGSFVVERHPSQSP